MNAGTGNQGAAPVDIREGNRCLLSVMGQHFMVDLVMVDKDTVRVTFPGGDYPVAGMPVDLEFHDTTGFNCYRSIVLKGPKAPGDGVVLRRPPKPRRNQHRDSCRVPTDLTVQVKDQVHVRRYDAALTNLSSGGALIESRAPFELHTTVEMVLSLPGEATHRILGGVVHVSRSGDARAYAEASSLFGVRFVGLEPQVSQLLTRYIWQRLRELYA